MKNTFFLLFFFVLFIQCHKECEQGYEGRKCQCELIPKVMTIDSISVHNFPLLNNDGQSFDPLNGRPDLCVVLKLGDSIIWSSISPLLELKEGAAAGNEYTFSLAVPIRLDTPELLHELLLFDFDSYLADGLDFMGGIAFSPYQSDQNFPNDLEISCSNCKVKFKLNVQYIF